MPDRNEYTVGWICAIQTEYTAARCFLDEQFESPESNSINDNNHYTLGKIGKHYVVMAVLPDGEYGISSATAVVKDMLHSFPNIRIGLMVGVAGGSPSPKRSVLETSLSVPRATAKVAFSTVTGLATRYESDGHQLEDLVNKILNQKPRLKRKYKRPDPNSDRLYRSDVVHRAKDESCLTSCGDDPGNLVLRPERIKDEDDDPAIHYGLIASADQLMKDAAVRDRLTAEKDVLCFEMEAAGLMNQFPCLVIRGICDYSDSHKNSEWQGYAAIMAAAYAKELLGEISPTKIELQDKISEIPGILTSIEQNLAGLTIDIHDTRDNVKDTNQNIKELKSRSNQTEITNWLSPPDPSTNYNKALEQRNQGSGGWFLESTAFDQWRTQSGSFLWLHGIPGCGKTILSSTIIENLLSYRDQSKNTALLYFYFDFSNESKQPFNKMIRSLIIQLYYYQPSKTSAYLGDLFSVSQSGVQQPSTQALVDTFKRMVNEIDSIWLVLDALDESTKEERQEVISWMRELNLKKKNIHILVTSRPELDIESGMQTFAHHYQIMPIRNAQIRNDIDKYIRSRVRETNEFKRWKSLPQIQEEIETVLMEKANGMFRWAACQLDALGTCLDYRNLSMALKSLPKTLDETYAKILREIPEEYRSNALRILQFLTYSEKPLNIEEAIDLIAVDITVMDSESNEYFNPNYRMPFPEEILVYCSSLVIKVPIQDEAKFSSRKTAPTIAIQLSHFSVKEYLISGRLQEGVAQNFKKSEAMASMAKVCLGYLLSLEAELPYKGKKRKTQRKEFENSYPFANYCARYWAGFAIGSESNDESLRDFTMQFFSHTKGTYQCCYSFYKVDNPYGSQRGPWKKDKSITPLYFASVVGLENVVRILLEQNVDIQTICGVYGNALNAAAISKNYGIMEMLLEKGADIDGSAPEVGTPLALVACNGRTETVEFLIEKGADINMPDHDSHTPLQLASFHGCEDIVKLLIGRGANVNAQGGKYGSALQAASNPFTGVYEGDEEHKARRVNIIKILLEAGADINAQGGAYGNALNAAIVSTYYDIISLLLKNGADVTAVGEKHGNALQAAVFTTESTEAYTWDKSEIDFRAMMIELLILKGVDVNSQGGLYGNALQTAVVAAEYESIKLLLDKGADVNAQGGLYGNALQAAVCHSRYEFDYRDETVYEIDILKLLLDRGANVNAKGGKHGNALQAALEEGNEKAFVLLVENGADIADETAKKGLCRDVLQAAIDELDTCEAAVKLLLSKGAEINVPGSEYGSALTVASFLGSLPIVELLLSHGADDLKACLGDEFNSGLSAAAFEGHVEIMNLLLETGGTNVTLRYIADALEDRDPEETENYEEVTTLLTENAMRFSHRKRKRNRQNEPKRKQ